jgi:hypothetical protein
MFEKVNGTCAWPQGGHYAAVRLNAITGLDVSWLPEVDNRIGLLAGALPPSAGRARDTWLARLRSRMERSAQRPNARRAQ